MRTPGLLVMSIFAAGLAMAADPALRIELGGGTPLDLVLVRAGEFRQGSPADEAGRGGDETPRSVRITRDYYIGRTAVTRGQWERFVSETGYRSEAEAGTSGGFGWDGAALAQRKAFNWRNPGFAQTADHPVCLVTFPDAQAFCAWLQRKTRRQITLPSEAQWEYACRAGTATPWHTGATPADADPCAWHKGNAGNGTRPADARKPNGWGLVIGGNVSEWCLDWYAPYQAGDALDPRQDNPSPGDKPRRVLRGGSWLREANHTRSAARYRADPRSRNADIGFRIVAATEITAAAPPRPTPGAAVLQAEAEPGAAPPPPVPPGRLPGPPRRTARAPGFSIGTILGGLLCLVVPLTLVVMLVRLVARSQATAQNPFVAPPPNNQAAFRTMDDGFWVSGDWPAGTALKLRYLTGGAATLQDLIYRPGPDGHFVYTGSRPDEVSVVTADAQASAPFTEPPVLPARDEDHHSGGPRPPVFPAAY